MELSLIYKAAHQFLCQVPTLSPNHPLLDSLRRYTRQRARWVGSVVGTQAPVEECICKAIP